MSNVRQKVTRALSAGVLCLASVPLAAQVVINEIDYDQSGTDAAEFLELRNTGPAAENLDDYSVELVNGSTGAVYDTIDLPNVSLAPGGYYVICANAATVAVCDFDDGPDTNFIQNGGPDAAGLRNSGVLVDAVSYEGDTAAPYTEGSGAGLQDDPSVADSGISRCPDGADTNQNNVDFIFAGITPGAANDCSGGTAGDPVINEFVANHTGSPDSEAFIEVFGDPGTDYSAFTILEIEGDSTGAGTVDAALPVGTTDAGGFYVDVEDAENGTLTWLLVEAFTGTVGSDLDTDNDGVLDSTPWTRIVDDVGVTDGGATDRNYGSTLLAAGFDGGSFTPGGASRIPNGTDTDSAADWLRNDFDGAGFPGFTGTPEAGEAINTPGAVNAPVPAPVAAVVINEILQNPAAVSDTFGEWFELVNASADPVDIDGWTIRDNGSNLHVIANGGPLVIPAGGYLVLGRDTNPAANGGLAVDYQYSNIFLGNGSDSLILQDTASSEVDRVEWDNGATFPDPNGASMALKGPGLDNNAGASWCESQTPFGDGDRGTPGAANDCFAGLVINEVDADDAGLDDQEFIEIYDGGAGNFDLSGLAIVLYNGSDDASYDAFDLDGSATNADGYFVICGDAASVPACDLDVTPDTNLIQNGADAVALHAADAADFPNDTPVTTVGLLDALVYDTGDADDAGLLALLNAGQPQIDEDGGGNKDFESSQRCPNGFGGQRNTTGYEQAAPTPGSLNLCSPLAIGTIQGAGPASPYDGFVVSIEGGIVTAVGLDGFYVQMSDGDPNTSDGIFVFTGGAPGVAVGDIVDVTGTVTEFFGFTEITGIVNLTITGTGFLPAAVPFNAAVPSPDPSAPSCAVEFECYEGMLVEIADGTVTGPNQAFGTDPIAEVFVTAAPARTFREPGVEFPGLMMPPIATWDGNPEVFELDPDKLGLPNQVIPAGSSFSATGVLGFEFGGYELWPTSLTVDPAPLPVAVRERAIDEYTIGSLNMFRFFDDVDDASDLAEDGRVRDDFVVSTAEYDRRRAKFTRYILEVLDAPDILAVQEVEKLGVLEDLAADIAAADPGVVYTPYLVEGNDVGTIDVGFMVRDTVQVDSVTQLGRAETYFNEVSGQDEILHDRPPLVLEGRYVCQCDTSFDDLDGDSDSDSDSDSDTDSDSDSADAEPGCGPGAGSPLKVMVVHNRSLGSIDDPTQGVRVRQKRLEQAESIAEKVQAFQDADPDVRLAVLGDFNAFEFSDGLVDVTGHMKGDFEPSEELVCATNACPDLVNPDLTDQVPGLAAGDRYSFIFGGNAQVLDHALTSQALDGRVTGYEYGRGNADAALDLINDDTIALRASDHDGLVVYLRTDCPRALKKRTLESLEGLLPTGDTADDNRIGQAIDAILDSLDSTLWIDGRHVASKKVFDREKKAVKALEKIFDHGFPGNGGAVEEAVAAAIENLVGADSVLAETAVAEAIETAQAAGCPATSTANNCRKAWKEIGKALDALAKAADALADGQPHKAIDDLRQAWYHAGKAIERL